MTDRLWEAIITRAVTRMHTFLLRICLFFQFPSCSWGLPAVHSTASEGASQISQMIRGTWKDPSDAMTILLIIGGDVIIQALAQLSGQPLTPVAFSFGWVGYSFNTLMSVVGNGRLMPSPDYEVKVINAQNGFARDNHSWVLGRLLRDFEHPLPDNVALTVTVFRATEPLAQKVHGMKGNNETKETNRKGVDEKYGRLVKYDKDWCWIIGVVVIFLQLGVAAIPCGLYGDWSILAITFIGTILALFTGALPQWRFEKWNCRPKTSKACCLTRGNGARTVMVILGCGVGPDLEDMAVAESPRLLRTVKGVDSTYTRVVMGLPIVNWITNVSCVLLSVTWIVLLITVTAVEQHHWFLLLIGGMGMLQNVLVAGARRSPGSRGIHLEQVEEFKGQKVMHALMDVERAYSKIGRSLLAEFFPDVKGLRKDEVDWWKGERSVYDKRRQEKKREQKSSFKERTAALPEDTINHLRVEWSRANPLEMAS